MHMLSVRRASLNEVAYLYEHLNKKNSLFSLQRGGQAVSFEAKMIRSMAQGMASRWVLFSLYLLSNLMDPFPAVNPVDPDE